MAKGIERENERGKRDRKKERERKREKRLGEEWLVAVSLCGQYSFRAN
jgi:hypothetical protein